MRPAGWNRVKAGAAAARRRPSWKTRCEAILLEREQLSNQENAEGSNVVE